MFEKILLILKNPKDSQVRKRLRHYLERNFHRYSIVDFILNCITSLKLKAPPGTIIGISRWRLRMTYRGCIRVDPGNCLKFEMLANGSVRKKRTFPSALLVCGDGNMVIVRGRLADLPTNLIVGGTGNRVELGSNFTCEEKTLRWIVAGRGNLLQIGDNCCITHAAIVGDNMQGVYMDGVDCSIKIGNNVRINLLFGTHPGTSNGFHLSIGDNSQIGWMRVSPSCSCRMTIGKNFYCSWGCNFWCSGHSILAKDGTVLNDCREIVIGDNVWFSYGVEVPGQVHVADGCIVGGHVMLVNDVLKPNSVVTVAPAKIYPINARWVKESPVMLQHGISHKDVYGRD